MLPIATPPHETRPWKDFQPFLKIRRHNEGLIPLWWCDIGWLAWIPSSAVEMCGAAVTCRNHSSWYFLLIPRVWNFIAFCWIYSMQHAMSHHSFKLSMQLLAVQGKHCRSFVRRLLHLGFHLPKAFQVFELLPSMQSIWCEISYSNHMCNQLKSHGSLYNRCTQYHSVCSRKKCCASCKIESLAKRGESPLSTGEISIRCHYKYDMVQYNYNIYHWFRPSHNQRQYAPTDQGSAMDSCTRAISSNAFSDTSCTTLMSQVWLSHMQSRSQVGMIVVEPYNRQHLLAMKIWAAWTHGEREHGWMDGCKDRT